MKGERIQGFKEIHPIRRIAGREGLRESGNGYGDEADRCLHEGPGQRPGSRDQGAHVERAGTGDRQGPVPGTAQRVSTQEETPSVIVEGEMVWLVTQDQFADFVAEKA